MPSLTAPRPLIAAAVAATALVGGCSADDATGSAPPSTLRDSVDVDALDAHRTAYLGDASSVSALAAAVDIGSVGDYTLALATDGRPYAVTFELTSLADGVTTALVDESMTDRAVLLLATIANADEIRWTQPGAGDAVTVLTRSEADELAGAPVAPSGDTVDGLADLVDRLEG